MVSLSNHDPLLDLFALDLPDLTFCAPDFSLALALALPDPRDPLDPWPCPPVMGGAPSPSPGILDDIWDVIRGAANIPDIIAKALSKLWDWIWGWIGGAVRWVYNQLESFSWWLFHQVEHWGGVVRDKVGDIGSWVWKQVEWWGGVVRDKVGDIGDWVWHQVEHWGGVVRDKVADVGEWVWHQVEWWGGVVRDKVEDVGDWVWHQVEHWGGVVRDKVEDTAGWLKDKILPPIMGAAFSVGDVFAKGLDLLGKALREALEAIGDNLADAIRWPWEHMFEPFADVVERKLAIPGKLLDGQYHDLRDLIDDVIDPPPLVIAGIAGAIILGLVIAMITTAITSILLEPLCLPHVQASQARVGAQLLTVGAIQEALNRGFIDEATAADHLSRAGYSGSAKDALLELRMLLPGASDLVRFGVREVWTPEIRQRFRQDEDFPEPFAEIMALQGFERKWVEDYWAAHWDLPSAGQGFEMLHRGVLEMPDLELLLRAADVMPFWRDKLIEIAYNPITRVDLRRLHKGGIITEDDVFNGYKALGYKDERARQLTDWTKKYYSPEDASELDDFTDLAASTIRGAYRRHVITRDDALDKLVDVGMTEDVADFLLSIDDAQLALNPTTDAGVAVRDLTVPIIRTAYAEKLWARDRAQQELEALGYLPWEADLLLQLEDLAEERALTELEESVVKELYLANAIDKPEASHQLDELKLLPERRDLLLRRWELQKAQKPKRLTLAQLEKAFHEELLSETELLGELTAMGYNDRDAKLLVDLTDTEPASRERRLSVGQLQRAYKLGAISDAQLKESLLALGYSDEDAAILVDMATPEPAAKERQLSAAQLQAGFRAGLVTETELLEKLTALGYAQADAELLRDIAAGQPESAARKLSVANLKELFKAGTLDKAALLVELLALGYTDRDATWLQGIIAPEE